MCVVCACMLAIITHFPQIGKLAGKKKAVFGVWDIGNFQNCHREQAESARETNSTSKRSLLI